MEIKVFEYADKLIPRGITYKATGSYTERFYTYGSFDVTIPLGERVCQSISRDRLVLIDRKFWAIIKNYRIRRGESSYMRVTGHSLLKWLDDRVIVPDNLPPQDAPAGYDSVAGTTETVIKHYVNKSVVYPVNPSRACPIKLAQNRGRGISNDAYYARFETVLSAISKIGERAKLGIGITCDLKDFVFDVFEGTDRTIHQRKLVPVIFSVDRGTLDNFEYIHESEDAANAFYCTKTGAEFEDEALTQTYYLDGETRGFDRVEKHLDISVDSDGNTYYEMEKVARKEMENHRPIETIVAEINNYYEYGKDYNLGDFITIQDSASGINIDRQIYEVETIVSTDAITHKGVFGQPQLNKLDKLQRRLGG